MSAQFLSKFFQLALPLPGHSYQCGPDAKSDLKLVLEIATNSRLKQGQDKKNEHRQIFYCRSLGKDCFKVEVEFLADSYRVLDDYTQLRHRDNCQKHGESPDVIRIYNLMMLKRSLIEDFMNENSLCDHSPESILQRISGDKGEYFYCSMVPDLESRRKLKKRFDNIINISIKKKREEKEAKVISIQKIEGFQPEPPKPKKSKRTERSKQNPANKARNERRDQSQQPDMGAPRKRQKMQSNSSIYWKNNQEEVKNEPYISQIKIDSIFDSQEEDYFKKKSEANIGININDIGSHIYWPESDHSIGQIISLSSRKDDIFASFRNSLLLRSVEKKSLGEISYQMQGFPFGSSDVVDRL